MSDSTKIDFLYLSEPDMIKAGVKDMKQCVETMEDMFYGCRSLESLDLSGWNTSNVTYMGDMFYDCPAPYEVIYHKLLKKDKMANEIV